MKSERNIEFRSRQIHIPHPHLLLLEEIRQDSPYFGLKSLPVDEIYSLPEMKYDTSNGDLFECFKPFLILGRCLGILPITGLYKKSHTNDEFKKLRFKWNSLATLTGIPIILMLVTNIILSCIGLFRIFAENAGGNASRLAFAAMDPILYSMGTFVYSFFLFRSQTLIQLLSKWRKVTSDLGFKDKDTKLYKHVNLGAGIIFVLGIIGQIFYNLGHFPILKSDSGQTTFEDEYEVLETYYWRSHSFWAHLIPYNPILSMLLLIVNTLGAFAWNYADIFIVLCSRALYYKFKILVEQTETCLLSKERIMFNKLHGMSWSQVRKDHLILCKLLEEFETFLSPLIFVSYSVNIFFICLELHKGLTPQDNNTALDSAFSAWSFAYLILRVVTVSLTAAKINEYAHSITICIQKCSSKNYCKELERLERMLATGPIGLSGFKCFVITRAFGLVVVSVIFTVEIVLLQASANPNSSQ